MSGRPEPGPYLGSLLGRSLARRVALGDIEGTRFSTGLCGSCGLSLFLAR